MFMPQDAIGILVLSAALFMAFAAQSDGAEEPFATGDFDSACALAAKTQRIVLIDFYTTWCGPCKKLDEITWQDSGVRAWLTQNAVSRKIDAEKESELAARYKVRAYPTVLLLNPDGSEIDRLTGYRDPETFLTEAKQALAGMDSVARAQAKLDVKGQEQPMARMQYGRALAEKGRNAEALEAFLWCLDEGNKYGPGFYGVRLSYLLNEISQLAAAYPSALTALEERREAARTALENGSADKSLAMDFAAYNERMGQQADTLAMYDHLKHRSETDAALLFHAVSAQLLEQQRYADLIAGTGDLTAHINAQLERAEAISASPQFDTKVKEYLKQNAVQTCAGFYEALLGTDRLAEADALRDKLLAFAPEVATWDELIQRAARAGKPETAQQLREAAHTTLSEEDFAQLDRNAS